MTDYMRMSRPELDAEYSPSTRAVAFTETLRRYRKDSERAYESLRCERDIAYGDAPEERLDFFPANVAGAPLQVFVHGGHWQELGREDSCFAAPDVVGAGGAFAAVGYGLAPGRTLDEMVASVRSALAWLGEHAAELGVGKIYASGSSAGAHLVAMALAADSPVRADGICLISGAYDLEPLRRSYVNDAVGMDEESALRNSPLHHLPLATDATIIAVAASETNEYLRQHAEFADALRATGHEPADLVVDGTDHFTLPLDLARPGTRLGDAVLRQMGL